MDKAKGVELTCEQYGTLWRAMVKIANGHSNQKRINREELVTIAREACDVVGWKYDAKALVGAV